MDPHSTSVACKTEKRVGPAEGTRAINAHAKLGRPTNEPDRRALSDALSRLETGAPI